MFSQPQAGKLEDIIGDWKSLDDTNTLSIEHNILKLNNLEFSYYHQHGTLFVRDGQNMIVSYPYFKKEETLVIQFPGNIMVIFVRDRKKMKEKEEISKEKKVEEESERPKEDEEEEEGEEKDDGFDIKPGKDSVDHSLWNFFLKRPPTGWKHSPIDNTANTLNIIFGHDVIPGMILLSPRLDVSKLEYLRDEMKKGLTTSNFVLQPDMRMKIEVDEKVKRCAGYYNGMAGIQITRAYVVGRICPNNTSGVTVCGIANQNVFSQRIVDAVNELSDTIVFKKPEKKKDQRMTEHFAGRWKHIKTTSLLFSDSSSSNTEEFYLTKDGRFYQENEYSFSGSNTSSNVTSSYMGVNKDKKCGTFKVVGDRSSGTILFYDLRGSFLYQSQYAVHQVNGVVYEREYYFDGKLFFKGVT